MKGKSKQRKMAARVGSEWWNRNDHISTYTPWGGWITLGFDEFGKEFEWPRPARCCVEASEMEDLLDEAREKLNA